MIYGDGFDVHRYDNNNMTTTILYIIRYYNDNGYPESCFRQPPTHPPTPISLACYTAAPAVYIYSRRATGAGFRLRFNPASVYVYYTLYLLRTDVFHRF